MDSDLCRELALKGKIVLLTNIDQGVGPATALAMVRRGASLAVTMSGDRVEPPIIRELRAAGATVALFRVPARLDWSAAAHLLRSVTAKFERLDIVIANSQLRIHWQVDDVAQDEDAIDEQFHVNVLATISLIRAVVRFMGEGGRIIAIGASIADRVGTPGLADFAASQAAIAAYCRGIAHDLGGRGITVNVVQLGAMDVDQLGAADDLIMTERNANVLKRLGRAEDAAEAIVFLAGPGASFITGSVLDVDGGYNA
ncbi:SDR family oxidoreductase [Rhizobium glycinendophyticum]|uniref:SDR family oxidoreductase n=1 Tax=Rhizobium glycinendophyticum TaxID=2589807 RepID=A0A504U683_9HYPH|nr:SDR family oxidoreductase [Rhizobium glycinendophyticum]